MKKITCIRIISMLLALLMLIGSGSTSISFAAEIDKQEEEISWVGYVNGDIRGSKMYQGEEIDVVVPVTSNFYQTVKKVKIELKDAPFVITESPKLYALGSDKVSAFIDSKNYEIRFSIKATETAAGGRYHLGITFVNGDTALKSYTIDDTIPMTVVEVIKPEANLNIENLTYPNKLSYKETGTISFEMTNTGGQDARNVTLAYEGFTDTGVLPNKKGTIRKIGIVAKDSRTKYTFPIKGSPNATSAAKGITVIISYRNTAKAVSYSTETQIIYITTTAKKVVAKKKDTETKSPKLVISNVKQSPAAPQAGGTVALSFKVKNSGTKLAKNITLTPKNLADAYLIPLDRDPYIYIKKLKVGDSQSFTLNFRVSEKTESEMSGIQMEFALRDSSGKNYDDMTKLYVTGIQIQDKEDAGSPKLIVEDYNTKEDAIKAGEEFELMLDIYNTNDSISADNIKVTITSSESTFSMAKGSDSFYISKIEPGEVLKKKLKLTVRADAVTKAYPLKIQFDYDFKKKSGKTVTTASRSILETLALQVQENPNPVLSNIIPGSYDEMIVGETNKINFDFTNRGKTSIYNVEVVITGGFEPAQKAYFIGTVDPGGGKTYEMEITPLEAGDIEGIITVFYEDSNGKKQKIRKKFNSEVAERAGVPPVSEVPAVIVQTKQPLMKLPVFLALQVILFATGFAVAQKTLVWLWKWKLRRDQDNSL